MVKAGTAFVDVQGDFSALNKQLDSAVSPLAGKFGKLGKAGAVGVGLLGAAAIGAGKALYDIGSQFDDAYDSIRTTTGKTGKALEGLKGDFKQVVKGVPTDFGSASKAVGQLNQRLGLSGKPLQAMSKQILELSRITGTDLDTNIKSVTRTFGDWGIKTRQQGPALDKMFRASQATGIEVSKLGEQMVKYGAPLRQMGFGFDEAAGLLGKFEKEGVNAELVMGSLRIALGRMAKEGVKDPAAALGKLTEGIKNAGSTGEANALALETFGARAGPDMAAAIREGRFDLGSLYDTIKNGDETIIGAGKETMDFAEKWQMFKNRVLVGLEPLAMRVFDGMAKGMDQIEIASAWLSTDGRRHWKNFRAGVQDVVDAIDGPLSAAFDFMLGVAQRVLPALIQLFRGAFNMIRGVIDLFAGLFTGDFGRMWDGIKAIFGGALDYLVALLRIFTAPFREAASRLGGAIIDGIKGLVGELGAAGGWVVDRITDGVKAAAGAIASAVSWLWQTFKGQIEARIAFVAAAGRWIIDKLRDGAKAAGDIVGDAAGWLIAKFGALVRTYLTSVLNVGRWVTDRVRDGIKSAGEFLADAGSWLVSRFATGVRVTLETVLNIGRWVTDRVRDGIKAAGDFLADAADWLVKKLSGALSGLKDGVLGIGGRLLDWIVDGIKSGATKAANAVVDIVNAIIGVLNKIPSVEIGKVGKIKASAVGGGGGFGAGLPVGAHPGDLAALASKPRLGTPFDRMGAGPLDRFKPDLPGVGDLVGDLPNPKDILPEWLHGLGSWLIGKAKDFIKDKLKDVLGSEDLGSSHWRIVEGIAAKFGNASTGPGQRTRPGDKGWHGKGRARDYSGGDMLGFARYMARHFGKHMLELIHTPLGYGIKNGKRVGLGFWPPSVNADHYDHVHTAFHDGGWAGLLNPPLSNREMNARLLRGEYVLNPNTAAAVARDGGSRPIYADIYIGGEKIDERVEVVVRENDRTAAGAYRAGVGG